MHVTDRGSRHTLQLAFAAFVLSMIVVVPVFGIVDCRSLEWGVLAGTRIDYTRAGYSETGSIAWDFYMIVTSVPTVPDYIINWTGLGTPELHFFWLNGTEMWPDYLYYYSGPGYPVLPIGNWTLMADFVNSEFTVNVTDSYNYWGYSYTHRYGSYETRDHVDFLKRDGVLAHLNLEIWNTSSNMKLRESSTTRAGLPIDLPLPPIILDNLVYIGASAAVLLVVMAALRSRRGVKLSTES